MLIEEHKEVMRLRQVVEVLISSGIIGNPSFSEPPQ
jgi:hypothetical protein